MSTKDPNAQRMEKIVSLCKRRGFIFQSSEIYGGLNGFWDYGPMGAELKRNLRESWWSAMMRERDDVVGLDASIIMHPMVWKASGHLDTFSDPMSDCLLTKARLRADQIEPQSGTVYWYEGARSGQTGFTIDRPFAVLLRRGEKAERARKLAQQFYAEGTLEKASGEGDLLELVGERTEEVTNSTRFNPQNGSLLTAPRPFNLMLRTHTGPVETDENIAYLRPETAQAIFVQFKNVLDSSRVKVPFGIGQIGKAFRNEINPRNYTFRSREFEQMELEFFIKPDEAIRLIHGHVTRWGEGADLSQPCPDWGWEMWHRYWVDQRTKYYASIGLGADVLDYHWQKSEELAHYARATVDILFKFPFGTEELEGIAARGDFDLAQHQKFSGKPLEVFDEELKAACDGLDDGQKRAFIDELYEDRGKPETTREEITAFAEKLFKGVYLPHVIEPSAGLDRMALAVLAAAFDEETIADGKGKTEIRTVLRLHPRVAPVKCAVFPLLKNKPELVAKAREVEALLRPRMNVFYDEAGAIGRRYRRQDEIGTPFCVTIDFDTIGEPERSGDGRSQNGPEKQDTVTLRHRDSMQQERIPIADLPGRLRAAVR
ncbi:MAG: glycine--tRNA ligase [Chthoniobacterales bacterium]